MFNKAPPFRLRNGKKEIAFIRIQRLEEKSKVSFEKIFGNSQKSATPPSHDGRAAIYLRSKQRERAASVRRLNSPSVNNGRFFGGSKPPPYKKSMIP